MGFPANHPGILAAQRNGLIPSADLVKLRPHTEAELTEAVIRLAQASGWLACHFSPALMPNGDWRTAFIGDKGFPDVIAVRGGRLVIAELKAGRNKVTPEQREWLVRLEAAGAEMFIWRPEDWDAIVEVFTAEVRTEGV